MRETCTNKYIFSYILVYKQLKTAIKINHEGGQGKNLKEFDIDETKFQKIRFFSGICPKEENEQKNFRF